MEWERPGSWDQVLCLGRKWDNLIPSPPEQGSRAWSHTRTRLLYVELCPPKAMLKPQPEVSVRFTLSGSAVL